MSTISTAEVPAAQRIEELIQNLGVPWVSPKRTAELHRALFQARDECDILALEQAAEQLSKLEERTASGLAGSTDPSVDVAIRVTNIKLLALSIELLLGQIKPEELFGDEVTEKRVLRGLAAEWGIATISQIEMELPGSHGNKHQLINAVGQLDAKGLVQDVSSNDSEPAYGITDQGLAVLRWLDRPGRR